MLFRSRERAGVISSTRAAQTSTKPLLALRRASEARAGASRERAAKGNGNEAAEAQQSGPRGPPPVVTATENRFSVASETNQSGLAGGWRVALHASSHSLAAAGPGPKGAGKGRGRWAAGGGNQPTAPEPGDQVVEDKGGPVAGEVIAIGIEEEAIPESRAASLPWRAEAVQGVVHGDLAVLAEQRRQLPLEIGGETVQPAAIDPDQALLGQPGPEGLGQIGRAHV